MAFLGFITYETENVWGLDSQKDIKRVIGLKETVMNIFSVFRVYNKHIKQWIDLSRKIIFRSNDN